MKLLLVTEQNETWLKLAFAPRHRLHPDPDFNARWTHGESHAPMIYFDSPTPDEVMHVLKLLIT